MRGIKRIITSVEMDHRIPFSWVYNSEEENWVAACNICNRIKYDRVFATLKDIRRYISAARIERGIELVWEPSISSEEDPFVWSCEFSKYLTSVGVGEIEVFRKEQSRIVFEDDKIW